ncbi:hypothetical protein U875_09710 [Pandoraea pnomenusa 3kgm]|uniref:hypothetical protein n=1 Tax=Pandoraea pnomenusa TaxID=93220 RepID=UPI0003C767A0|nr:hypothetical protein [Pandoraea pnomenusa]AHB08392.1 hypothetical protein U875_09710 [Pandoraea pnomenusa 3kgm]
MSQDSLNIPTTGTLSGLALVQAINAALANLATNASGATDPSSLPGGVLPYSLWFDTSSAQPVLRQRNSANGAWTGLAVAPGAKPHHVAQLQQVGHGQCRLNYVTATSIALVPCDGQNLLINGVPQPVPAAGVVLANTGLAASTFFYIYAYMSGDTMTLEPSTTAYAVASNGVVTKAGDAARTLVGAVFTSAGGQFQSNSIARCVISYFNRRALSFQNLGTVGAFTNTTHSEVSTARRVAFIAWADDAVEAVLTGSVTNSTQTGTTNIGLDLDGATAGPTSSFTAAAAGNSGGVASGASLHVSEGILHNFQIFGSVSASTSGSMAAANISGVVRG